MVTAWSQPDRVVRVRLTASAPLNHSLMVIIPLVLINLQILTAHSPSIHLFLLLLFATGKITLGFPTHKQTRSFPLFPIFIFDSLYFLLCNTLLPHWIAPFQNTHSLARQGYAADPDRCNFCPIRLPFFRFSFLPLHAISFPTLGSSSCWQVSLCTRPAGKKNAPVYPS